MWGQASGLELWHVASRCHSSMVTWRTSWRTAFASHFLQRCPTPPGPTSLDPVREDVLNFKRLALQIVGVTTCARATAVAATTLMNSAWRQVWNFQFFTKPRTQLEDSLQLTPQSFYPALADPNHQYQSTSWNSRHKWLHFSYKAKPKSFRAVVNLCWLRECLWLGFLLPPTPSLSFLSLAVKYYIHC